MNSISTCNSQQETILSIKNLNLVFNLDYYHHTNSLRDTFVRMIKSPIDTLFKPKETLHIINNISFDLKKNERLGILGVNGVGKTTLCRSVAGMLVPKSGSIKVNGEVRSVFDTSIGINPELTGKENAHLLARFFYPRENNKTITEIVNESLQFTELNEFINIPFMNYSKGMQARLCLSVISAKSCDLLILDEVFDGADEFFQKKVAERVLTMIRNSGAVIFVSHSPEQIKLACNRCIVLENSKIAYDGDVDGGINYYHQNNSNNGPADSLETNPTAQT